MDHILALATILVEKVAPLTTPVAALTSAKARLLNALQLVAVPNPLALALTAVMAGPIRIAVLNCPLSP
jgi:hypothetical protein